MKKQGKSNTKLLIFGRGQIGTMYHNYFIRNGYESFLSPVDITKANDIEKEIVNKKPDVVINAAAKTNLEWVETNKLQAFNVNTLGADNIAGVCQSQKKYFLHLSSGCIFQSRTPGDKKKEEDVPEPAAFYSWTKVWAENLITARKRLKYLILRPRQPVSSEVSDKNMLVKMLTFSKFLDDRGGWNSGTVLEDLMWITERLIKKNMTGVLHVANNGWTTPYKIGLLLKEHINPSMKIKGISQDELDQMTPVKRVATVLDISKLESLGIKPENYEKRLEETIILLKENLKKAGSREVLKLTEKTVKTRSTTNTDWQKIFADES